MIIEDARELTLAAVQMMEDARVQMRCPAARLRTVREFLAHAEQAKLTRSEREIIVDQAILILDQLYAHLPFKRARYAVDPVQRLRLIRSQLQERTDLEFHKEMVQVFTRLRDAHTFYGLPRPFRGSFAFLPFQMKCFYDTTGGRRFLVTNVMEGFQHPGFQLHAEITFWNGMTVERAVEREGGYDPLGNEAARFVRALNKMSNRSLSFAIPPEEEWVVLLYRPKNADEGEEQRGILLPWYIATDCLKPITRKSAAISVNESLLETAQARKYLWSRGDLAKEWGPKGADSPANPPATNLSDPDLVPKPKVERDPFKESKFPALFEFQHSGGPAMEGGVDPAALSDPNHPDSRFGYVRIRSFDHQSADQFVEEFGRILDILQAAAPDGLIVDVRSNPGGAIDAAERALGLLTPGNVQPAFFHFLNTRMTQQIADCIKKEAAEGATGPNRLEWQPWVDDLVASVFSGGVITAGRHLSSPGLIADSGQRYQGPVTLVINALSYSAADLFAAGFQDNDAGQIIGVDENTGGGGANRWLHDELLAKLEGLPGVPLVKLPGEAQLGLAIRRSSRAGRSAGNVIEDIGVRRDIAYQTTLDDLLHADRDLLGFACGHLGTRPRHGLRILSAKLNAGAMDVEVRADNLHRLEFLVNGLPQCSFAAGDPQPFLVPTTSLKDRPGVLRVNGFALEPTADLGPELRLVVCCMLQLETAQEPGTPVTK